MVGVGYVGHHRVSACIGRRVRRTVVSHARRQGARQCRYRHRLGRPVKGLVQVAHRDRGQRRIHRHQDIRGGTVVVVEVFRRKGHAFTGRAGRRNLGRRREGKAARGVGLTTGKNTAREGLAVGNGGGRGRLADRGDRLVDRHEHGGDHGLIVVDVIRREGHTLVGPAGRRLSGQAGEGEFSGDGGRSAGQGAGGQGLAICDRRSVRIDADHRSSLVHRQGGHGAGDGSVGVGDHHIVAAGVRPQQRGEGQRGAGRSTQVGSTLPPLVSEGAVVRGDDHRERMVLAVNLGGGRRRSGDDRARIGRAQQRVRPQGSLSPVVGSV